MNTADDIAYGVHDLVDAIHLFLISRDEVDTAEFRTHLHNAGLANENYTLLDNLFSAESHLRKQAIGTLVNYFITSVKIAINQAAFQDPLLKHRIDLLPPATRLLDYLKNTIYQHVIDSKAARASEQRAHTVILRLFEAMNAEPQTLLEAQSLQSYQAADSANQASRVICDSIANMTDECAYRMHGLLFESKV